MADLIVQAHAIPAIRVRSYATPTQIHAKSPVKSKSGGHVFDTLTKTLRSVHELWWSWKDGLTAEERRLCKSREEKRRSLCLRMQNVSFRYGIVVCHLS